MNLSHICYTYNRERPLPKPSRLLPISVWNGEKDLQEQYRQDNR